MQTRVCAIAVRQRLRELAIAARKSVLAMCQAQGSFDDKIWLKPVASPNESQIQKPLAEYRRLAFPVRTKKTDSNAALACVSLRWLFPVPLLELVSDATRISRISLDEQTLALALLFQRLFAGEDIAVRFRPEAFAFGVTAEEYEFEELARTAHGNVLSFLSTLLHRTLGVDAALNVYIDSELQTFPDNNAGRRKRRLLLILGVLGSQFTNGEFCELYDGCRVETSKTCGRLLEDLASLVRGMEWDSEKGVKKLSGLTVDYLGCRETIIEKCRDILLRTVAGGSTSIESKEDSGPKPASSISVRPQK